MNIIITGASRGIGKAIVQQFASENKHQILIIARNENSLREVETHCKLKFPQTKIWCLAADLNEPIGIENCVNFASQTLPYIDILINNAGYLHNEKFANFATTEMHKIFDINFFAPAILIQKLLPQMWHNQATHIVNISSIGGYQGSNKFAGLSFYSASKAALAILTECLAVELASLNIKCNCLALGAVQTEMLAQAFPNYRAPLTPEQIAEFIADFALNGYKYFNGKILPVSVSTP